MKVYTCDQRSDDWRQLRVGMFTASSASDMLAKVKTGEAAARRDLRVRLALERITGCSQESGYVNADMQRGTDMEPLALAAYEAMTGEMVKSVGFLAHDTLRAGCSPDGVLGDFEGGLEIKCPKSATHLGYLKAQTLPADYVGQVTHSLWITGARFWDFISFDDRFPAPLQLFHVRVERDEAAIKSYELLVRMFLAEVDSEVLEVERMVAVAA